MSVMEWLVRAVACVVCAGLMTSEAVAVPLGLAAAGGGGAADVAAPYAAVDVCASDVGTAVCDQRGVGELVAAPVTVFERFTAHVAEADGAQARLALAAALTPGDAEAETTLMTGVAGMVRQVPEPPALGLWLTALAMAGCVGRARVRS
jgi:hypothetical protein